MPLPNPLYIPIAGLQNYFVDKDTAQALSGGVVTFYSDVNRTTKKNIYQQTQLPDNTYEFSLLGNPVTLTAVGTFADESGNDINVYLFPYEGTEEAPGEIELYYIKVYSRDDVFQFSREAQPPNVSNGTNPTDTFEASENQISNPQFSVVLFTPSLADSSYTYNASGSNYEFNVAPDWVIVTNGTGTVTVKKVPVSNPVAPTNPYYVLDINSSGITDIKIRQRLTSSPRIFLNGFLSSSISVASLDNDAIQFIMNYVPSTYPASMSYQLLNGLTTADGSISNIVGTVSTSEPPFSTAIAPDGYVDIDIVFPAARHVQITSVQIASVQNASSSVEFLQESYARQLDHLAHYYNPLIAYKQIPSILTAWDFPLNPAQNGSSFTMVNSPSYYWDQLIACAVNSNNLISRNTVTDGLQITTGGSNDSFYIMQYMSGASAKKILGSKLSINVNGYKTLTGSDVTMNIKLFRAPSTSSFPLLPASIGTLSNTGSFSLTASGWTEVLRSNYGDAITNLSAVSSPADINKANVDYGFSGWEITDNSQILNTDKFAIVVIFTYPDINTVIIINSISLVQGSIPSRPAPQLKNDVLRECRYYYEKSYDIGTLPGSITSSGRMYSLNEIEGTSNDNFYLQSFWLSFIEEKISIPLLTFYSPASSSPNLVQGAMLKNSTYVTPAGGFLNPNNFSINNWNTSTVSKSRVFMACNNTSTLVMQGAIGSSAPGDEGAIFYHYVANARLGEV